MIYNVIIENSFDIGRKIVMKKVFKVILILIIFVAIMIEEMKQENKLSAYLQIPYFIWLLFALYLNVSIYILN